MSADVLSPRALNRATLARQLLLERSPIAPLAAVEHLVGMQAQVPHNPYLGLWSRLTDFAPETLSALLIERAVVRIVVMRATIHLVSAADCLTLRPLMQPVLDAELRRHREYAPALVGVDLVAVLAFARAVVEEAPRTGTQLRAALHERFPEEDAAALAYACRNRLAFVQVPPRGVWGRTLQVTSTTAEAWLGRPLDACPSIDDVVLRYLRAFGPATVADVASWSRLTAMGAVVERLAGRLQTFRDERGRTLYDLPDAPRPDIETPAPPRFLPEYDNVLLSHADRTRFMSAERRGLLGGGDRAVHGSLLVDGVGRATWRIEDGALFVDHVGRFGKREADAIEAEGRRMLGFLERDGVHDVRFVALD